MKFKKFQLIIPIAIGLLILLQLIPWRVSRINFFETHKVIFTSFGTPFNFLTFYTRQIPKTGKIEHLLTAHSFWFLSANLGIIIISGLVLWRITKKTTLRRKIIAFVFIITVMGVSISFCQFPTLWWQIRKTYRNQQAANAIENLKKNSSDQLWLKEQKKIVEEQTENNDAHTPWITQQFILAKNGEWLAYHQECQKEDRAIDDMLIMKGSDGKWYYTDRHICVDMFAFRMMGFQYDDIESIVNDPEYELICYEDEKKLLKHANAYRGWSR